MTFFHSNFSFKKNYLFKISFTLFFFRSKTLRSYRKLFIKKFLSSFSISKENFISRFDTWCAMHNSWIIKTKWNDVEWKIKLDSNFQKRLRFRFQIESSMNMIWCCKKRKKTFHDGKKRKQKGSFYRVRNGK